MFNGEGRKHFLRRNGALPGCPHAVRCPVSAKIRGHAPVSAKIGSCAPGAPPSYKSAPMIKPNKSKVGNDDFEVTLQLLITLELPGVFVQFQWGFNFLQNVACKLCIQSLNLLDFRLILLNHTTNVKKKSIYQCFNSVCDY